MSEQALGQGFAEPDVDDQPMQLDGDTFDEVSADLMGAELEFENDSPLEDGRTEDVQVVDLTALEIRVESEDTGLTWWMNWDRTLKCTNAASKTSALEAPDDVD